MSNLSQEFTIAFIALNYLCAKCEKKIAELREAGDNDAADRLAQRLEKARERKRAAQAAHCSKMTKEAFALLSQARKLLPNDFT